MEITEVRIFPRESDDRKLKAYATITIDDAFVVRNVKVIEGTKGLFVAMPSRKLRESCPKCNYKNAVRSKFCNQCGSSLPQTEKRMESTSGEDGGKQSGHRDIAHPITPECREYIQARVLEVYSGELKSPAARSEKYEPPKFKKETINVNLAPEFIKPRNTHSEDDFEGDLEL